MKHGSVPLIPFRPLPGTSLHKSALAPMYWKATNGPEELGGGIGDWRA